MLKVGVNAVGRGNVRASARIAAHRERRGVHHRDQAVTDAVASLVAAESNRIELAVTLVVDTRVFAVCKRGIGSPTVTDSTTHTVVSVDSRTVNAISAFTSNTDSRRSADNEIEAKTAELKTVCIEPQQTVTDIVDGQVKLDPEKPAADNVLCVNGASVTLGGVTVENGRVNVEGLAGGEGEQQSAFAACHSVSPARAICTITVASGRGIGSPTVTDSTT